MRPVLLGRYRVRNIVLRNIDGANGTETKFFAHGFEGAVFRAVVDNDDFKFRVI